MNAATGITIRRAEVGDAEQVARLAADTFGLACPKGSDPKDVRSHVEQEFTAERFVEQLNTTGVSVYVALDSGIPVGYAMLIGDEAPPVEHEFRRSAQLCRLYVREEYHGAGVAHALLRRCVRHARTHDYDLMWLGSNQENERAIAFYTRHKFEVVGTREFQLGASIERDYVLARTIDQP